MAVYTDKASHFTSKFGKEKKSLVAKKTETQWERAMRELGVNHILAHSPQAKGRVERCFRTF
ncbi:MAG: hypothetical protein LBE31_03110, partial [Deltaproteobacteria bacterium]|nr:hypothetical protein [Deltaproteobacteria bacterium]